MKASADGGEARWLALTRGPRQLPLLGSRPLRHLRRSRHGRAVWTRGRAEAELAVIVVAPAVEPAVPDRRTRVRCPEPTEDMR